MKSLIFSCVCAMFTLAACGQAAKPEAAKPMPEVAAETPEQKAVAAAATQFLEGGDKSDAAVLDAVLHPDYRLVLNRVFGDVITKMDKTTYLKMIADKKIGGVPRKATINSVVAAGNVGSVDVTTVNEKAEFRSFLQFLKEPDGKWRLVSDVPFVQFKK
jgi:Putative lumazine-binding